MKYVQISKKIGCFLLLGLAVISTSMSAKEVLGADIPFKINIYLRTQSHQFTIPTTGDGYDYSVDCDDDGPMSRVYHITGDYTCTYPEKKGYTVSIVGDFSRIYFNNSGDKDEVMSIEQWGTIQWKSMSHAFEGCTYLSDINPAAGTPNLTDVTDVSYMFAYANAFNAAIGNWDMSNVLDMRGMFSNGGTHYYYRFNQYIGDWNVSNVTDMTDLFFNNTAFNQDIGNWDVSSVKRMVGMFASTYAFNQYIGDWNVSNVINMSDMFRGAHAFNQDIGDWDVSGVEWMDAMFAYANTFNQNIGNWDTPSLKHMRYMFTGVQEFNQDIGNWNVSMVEDMEGVFKDAVKFNQDIGYWNITNASNMNYIFDGSALSIGNYDSIMTLFWNQRPLKLLVEFGAQDSYYCTTEQIQNLIVDSYQWTFDDKGKNCDFYITSPNYIEVKDKETFVGMVIINTAVDDTRFMIVGGTDKDKFKVNNQTGELRFINPPDITNPLDSNKDNIYRVQVEAKYSTHSDSQTIYVSVSSGRESIVSIINYLLD